MSKLNEKNASSEDSDSSRSESPLTLEKLKKQQENIKGFIRNPDYKGPLPIDEKVNTKLVPKKIPQKKEQARRPSSILNRRSSIL
jgi:hypothetical protein